MYLAGGVVKLHMHLFVPASNFVWSNIRSMWIKLNYKKDYIIRETWTQRRCLPLEHFRCRNLTCCFPYYTTWLPETVSLALRESPFLSRGKRCSRGGILFLAKPSPASVSSSWTAMSGLVPDVKKHCAHLFSSLETECLSTDDRFWSIHSRHWLHVK